MSKLPNINNRIENLTKRKAKLQTQQAVLFRHETEKIFLEDFCPDIAWSLLSDWTTETKAKKKEWTNKAHSPRISPAKSSNPKNCGNFFTIRT